MTAKPFLLKFACPIHKDNTEIRTAGYPDQNVKEKFQNRRHSTIVTKVDRETTDDR